MEGFAYEQHHPLLLDSVYYPNTPIEMPLLPQQVGEITSAPSCFPYYYYCPSEATPELSTADAKTYESCSSLDSGIKIPHHGGEVPTPQASVEKKRKNCKGTSSSSVQSNKGPMESKSRKQKKPSGGLKGTEEKKHKADDLKAMKACEDPPEGYIHVRARRGQATDSHSLAERVRRERISERMKMLQGLVPGCEKLTGKALVLDEIINYVQSLQNQVEFLSMKLASMNPILYELGEDYDDCMNQQEKMGSNMPSVIQTMAYESATNNYPMMDSSASLLLHGQGPTSFPQPQDNDSFLVQVGDRTQGFHNQVEFSNMCSFQ